MNTQTHEEGKEEEGEDQPRRKLSAAAAAAGTAFEVKLKEDRVESS